MDPATGGEDVAVELARLREENAHLRRLLGLDDRPDDRHVAAWSPTLLSSPVARLPVDASSSNSSKLELLWSLFGARSDVYGARWENAALAVPTTAKCTLGPGRDPTTDRPTGRRHTRYDLHRDDRGGRLGQL